MSLEDLAAAAGLSADDLDLLDLLLREEGVELEAEAGIRRQPATTEAPLSFSQERLWFLDRLMPGSAVYNMPGSARLLGRLEPAVIARAFGEIVRRHEALRTTFASRDGEPVQVIGPPQPVALPLVDLAGLPGPAGRGEVGRLVALDPLLPFDLERGPLLRLTLLKLGPEEHALLVTVHHIVSDGWSVGILISELATLYEAFAAGRPSPLPELPVQYADFARWQRERLAGAELPAQLAFWRERLAGSPPALDLPADRPRPAIQTYRGASEELAVPRELAVALAELARREGASLFMVLLAAFDLLLARLAGQEDVLVGTPIAGRGRQEVEGLIGFFLNTLVLRVDLSGGPSFRGLVSRVRESALAAYANQDVPFEKLLEDLQPERDLSRTPLFQVLFNMLNYPATTAQLPGLTVEAIAMPETGSKFDLTVYAAEVPADGRILMSLVYNADLFDAERVREMARQYRAVLARAVEAPDLSVTAFSLVTPEATALLPDPAAPLSDRWVGAVHELFAARAAADPGLLAVAGGDGDWTSGELAESASRLAAWLRAHGVQKGDRVAVHAHRSAPLVWAVLGVLEAGAAFVILDPAYPGPRLLDTLRLAAPRGFVEIAAAGAPAPEVREWVAANAAGCRLVLPGGGPAAARAVMEGWPAPAPAVQVGPDDLAYVAFTSGSTGVPKGILGRHGPLSHFLPWQSETFGLGESDRYSLLSGLAHDPLQRDIFTPLCLGGAIAVPAAEDVATPGRLAAWMARAGVTVAHLTPAMAQILTEPPPSGEPAEISALRWAFLVGDVLTRLDVDRLRRVAPGVTVVNFYGSTETQRAVGYHLAQPAPAGAADVVAGTQVLPLGRGMEDVQLLVLTRAMHRAGIGEVGEICVRSPHLAAGYLDDPTATAERFLVNPATGRPGDRIYRTGDLGRYLPDGQVAFAGRADRQVKIRGFRVEPGEIEAALGRLPGVREAVIVARQDGPGGAAAGRRLVAYVVADGGRPDLPGELREALRRRLPAYMVPAAFVLLERLPVTPNGKVDRRALERGPAPEGLDAGLESAYVGPRDDLEEAIAAVWREVLGLPRVGVEHNFFDLGGHSLLLVRLHARLEAALGRGLTLIDLFNYPNVRALADHLRSREASAGTAAAGGAGTARDRAQRQIEASRRQVELARARRGGT